MTRYKAEQSWDREVTELANATLYPHTDSWYTGASIPGKPRQFCVHLGEPLYFQPFRGRVLGRQKQLGNSSQCVRLSRLRPRLWNEAAPRETTLIEQGHQDDDPALAKDTDQA
jgi:hypothetical protein